MNTPEIKKVGRLERLQAIEALWDSLLDEKAEIESPKWHWDVLKQRKRKIETGEAEFISNPESVNTVRKWFIPFCVQDCSSSLIPTFNAVVSKLKMDPGSKAPPG